MNGYLGSAAPAANTYTTLYTVPADKSATVNVAAVNRGTNPAKIRVAFTTQATTPVNRDFIEFDASMPERAVAFERSGQVIGQGEKVMVWSDNPDITFRVSGFEGAAE